MLRAMSSNSTESQSSNTTTLPLSENSYNLEYRPRADIAPLTTSYLGLRLAKVLNISFLFNTPSTPNDLPTPGGPVTIIALTLPSLTACVMSFNILKRDLIRSTISSSLSWATSSSDTFICSKLPSRAGAFGASPTAVTYDVLASQLIRIFLAGMPELAGWTVAPSTVTKPPNLPCLNGATSLNLYPAMLVSTPRIL